MQFRVCLPILALALSISITGCGVSHGNRFDVNTISSIQPNVTTEGQIRATFGEPVEVRIDGIRGVKVLTYVYDNNDEMKRTVAALGGAILGGVIGHQFGGGSGRDIATSVGTVAGGALGSNAVTTRQESQVLDVIISLQTGRVVDYIFNQSQNRSQSWQLNQGVAPL